MPSRRIEILGTPVTPLGGEAQMKNCRSTGANPEQAFSFNALHYKLVEQFSPPSVLINENYDILHMSKSRGRYLQLGSEPTSIWAR